jgi:hypothetical protein
MSYSSDLVCLKYEISVTHRMSSLDGAITLEEDHLGRPNLKWKETGKFFHDKRKMTGSEVCLMMDFPIRSVPTARIAQNI